MCLCVCASARACVHACRAGIGGPVDSLLVYVDTGGYNRGNCILLL